MNTNNQEQQQVNPTKGYKIIITALAIAVVVISGLFLMNINDLKEANLILNDEKIALSEELTLAVEDLGNMTTENEEINKSLEIQKHKADSLLTALGKERSFSRAKIRQYEKELGTLRTIMKKYVYQIDSLNTANKTLSAENIKYRTELRQTQLRADASEEQNQELTQKLRKGSQIAARDIDLIVSRKPNGSMTRATRAKSMKIDFVLSSNSIALPGERAVYARVITPEGYPLAESSSALFDYEGEKLTFTAARDIDYQNDDLAVSLYYDCEGLKAGKYIVEIYMDSLLVGSANISLK